MKVRGAHIKSLLTLLTLTHFLQGNIYIYISFSWLQRLSHNLWCFWELWVFGVFPPMLKSQAENFVMFLRAMRVWSFPTNVYIKNWKRCDVFESYESLEFSHQCLYQKLKTLWCFWELWVFGVFPPMFKSQAENFVMFLRAMRVWSFPTNVDIKNWKHCDVFESYESLEVPTNEFHLWGFGAFPPIWKTENFAKSFFCYESYKRSTHHAMVWSLMIPTNVQIKSGKLLRVMRVWGLIWELPLLRVIWAYMFGLGGSTKFFCFFNHRGLRIQDFQA